MSCITSPERAGINGTSLSSCHLFEKGVRENEVQNWYFRRKGRDQEPLVQDVVALMYINSEFWDGSFIMK